jgi:hypothetical protein
MIHSFYFDFVISLLTINQAKQTNKQVSQQFEDLKCVILSTL